MSTITTTRGKGIIMNKMRALAFAIIVVAPAAFGQWNTSGNNIYNTNTGNVGVGTGTAVVTKFQINLAGNTGGIANGEVIRMVNTTAGSWSSFHFTDNTTSDGYVGFTPGTPGNLPTRQFGMAIDSNTPGLFLDGNGNVGIGMLGGNVTPGNKLQVNGNVNISGNIAAKYQDFAEWVPATEHLKAGTVVVLNTTKTNEVMASAHAYDTAVAGVVSVQPGLILGEGASNKEQIATSGRVLVRVDATKNAIHVGDLLVTGEKPGLAMKSEPVDLGGVKIHRPGTIVGKALQPLEKGEGEILVLLSLQ